MEANYFTILYWFCHTSTWICHRYTRTPHPEHPPSLSPYYPSGSTQCTSPKHPVSCIEPWLVIHFIYDIIHASMPFSQIIPPSPSSTESKRLFYTSVSLLLAVLIPACASSSLSFPMIYSAYKLNKQGENIQPWRTLSLHDALPI